MKGRNKSEVTRTNLSLETLTKVSGGSGSNTVFVLGNGETGILLAGGMSGGTGFGNA